MTAATRKKIADFKTERSSFRERMKARLESTSAKQRQEALFLAGIVTASGKLAPAYRSPEEPGVKSARPAIAKLTKKKRSREKTLNP